ncbi:PQQ-binding-like beta-propeller repeat protein [Halorubellus sp. JP-L1]|uniref:outer membrane protein assembly factor BamB family protein n=1 Tax=Halorubellus sp. JP-L1 TaxID=2715753 RepID=UPI00140CA34F|nr:PQQ-binding-like beta-propeller repeat protein [Halorubellus sp. JP-L1]NHN43066.1 PQQ-binding-like beta-propeller repeat protein [Halorubellus sp. JP-L1]
MQDGSSRRRLLEVGALGALAGLGGCLRLTSDDGTTADGATDSGSATTAPAATDRSTEGDGESDGTETADETESDPSTREISGPASVDHTFVDPQNGMAQPDASAPATAPIVDWEHAIDGGLNTRIFSGPLVTADALVVSSYRDVVAYERGGGGVRWRLSESAIDDYRTTTRPNHREGAVVLVGSNDRTREWELVALESADGTKRWSVTLPVAEEEQPRASLVDGSRAVVVTGSMNDASTQYSDLLVVDLDAQSVTYEARLADAQLNPEDLALDGDTLLVTTDEAASGVDNVVAFDLAERERRWSKRLPIGESIPVLGDDDVYLATESDTRTAAVRALARSDGSETWTFDLQSAPRTGVTVAHGRVYAVTNNKLYAVDATDGTPTWSYAPTEGPRIHGGSSQLPVATSEHLLLGSNFGEDGTGAVRAVTVADGELAWRVDLPHVEVYSPFVVDDHLYAFGRDREDGTGGVYALH